MTAARRAAARAQATARQRRYRERQGCGVKVAPVPVGNDEISFLLDLHWLNEAASEDARKIGLAIAALLREAAKAHKK